MIPSGDRNLLANLNDGLVVFQSGKFQAVSECRSVRVAVWIGNRDFDVQIQCLKWLVQVLDHFGQPADSFFRSRCNEDVGLEVRHDSD